MDGENGSFPFADDAASFRLFSTPQNPSWRSPQIGALGALLSHWSLARRTAALISLPTGTGKTAVGVAAPYLLGARRVLAVVPSKQLRRQSAEAFREGLVLRSVGALGQTGPRPRVVELTGRVGDWSSLERSDVVVAIPNSISPAYYEDRPPPPDLFDLIVIDEAHHVPAKTWQVILEHFADAHALLLTATPRRRDNKRVPGDLVYHYPLHQAIAAGIFHPLEPRVLPLLTSSTQEALDNLIADEVMRVLSQPDHATSSVLIRAKSVNRAEQLAALYNSQGLPTQILHSSLRQSEQLSILDGLQDGRHRSVAVVAMLNEGFDLPRLRVLAYHDKLRSMPATAQLLGRLARVDPAFPQTAVLVTVRDIDIYPELHGVTRRLYEEDEDWAVLLPGILDTEIAEDLANRDFARQFSPSTPTIALDAVHPLRRAVLQEVEDVKWTPPFAQGEIPAELLEGQLVRGRKVLYSGLSPDNSSLMIITGILDRPPWHDAAGLDSERYALHMISFRESRRTDLRNLLLLNTDDGIALREILSILGADTITRPADPNRLNEAFESLDRISVSNVGMRNTYGGGPGTTSYRTFVGRGVDRSLREIDTAFGAVGHAMIQAADSGGAYTAGMSTGKGKYWETRYTPLREYEEFITQLSERYWYPPVPAAGQLLPQVTRARRLVRWPDSPVVAVEMNHALIGSDWAVPDIGPVEFLDLSTDETAPSDLERLNLTATLGPADAPEVIWRGYQDLFGGVHPIGTDLEVRRGFGARQLLSELLADRPPTVYFLNGAMVHGITMFDSRVSSVGLPLASIVLHPWTGTDIKVESRPTPKPAGASHSVHEALEGYLRAQTRHLRHRWIIANDGRGEFADYLVIETGTPTQLPRLSLWHAKAAGGPVSVRVTDFQEAVAQAIKSRRWLTDVAFWEVLGQRLVGQASPRAYVIEGSQRQLETLCGLHPKFRGISFLVRKPRVRGEIGIAQPGLSKAKFEAAISRANVDLAARQTRDLLAVFHDSVAQVASSVLVLCSP